MLAMDSSPEQPAPAAPKPMGSPTPDKSGTIQLTARLTPESHRYLELMAEAEDISLNDALNLVISRQYHYPKDMAEIHQVLTYLQGQFDLIAAQMELSQQYENRLIDLIEGGEVEKRLEEIRDREEAALEARQPPPPNPSAPDGA